MAEQKQERQNPLIEIKESNHEHDFSHDQPGYVVLLDGAPVYSNIAFPPPRESREDPYRLQLREWSKFGGKDRSYHTISEGQYNPKETRNQLYQRAQKNLKERVKTKAAQELSFRTPTLKDLTTEI